MKPKIQKPITFKNKCRCICDINLLENAMLWISKKPLMSKRTIFMFGRYPGVSIYDEKMHIHRLLKSYQLQRKLESNEHVHHKDRNILNCRIDNLVIMEAGIHISSHLKGIKQDREFALRRINKTCLTRYGHPIKHFIHETLE